MVGKVVLLREASVCPGGRLLALLSVPLTSLLGSDRPVNTQVTRRKRSRVVCATPWKNVYFMSCNERHGCVASSGLDGECAEGSYTWLK